MHGMTKSEVAEFKCIKDASRSVKNRSDIERVKRMAADFVKSAKSMRVRVRRRAAMQAVRFVHSHF